MPYVLDRQGKQCELLLTRYLPKRLTEYIPSTMGPVVESIKYFDRYGMSVYRLALASSGMRPESALLPVYPSDP